MYLICVCCLFGDCSVTCLGGEGKGRKRRKQADETSSSGEDGSDEERPKKRGRPPLGNRERIKGFTDAEIRRFVKSYKKFAAPLKRLDAVACDAELQEKPLAELKKLGELLHERCEAFMVGHVASKENESNGQDESNMSSTARSKKRARGPSFKLGGVSVNAKTMMACEQELAPLDEIMPSSPDERHKWLLETRTKPAHFDVEWTNVEDSKLLLGIYQYGMGSWEAIKMDRSRRACFSCSKSRSIVSLMVRSNSCTCFSCSNSNLSVSISAACSFCTLKIYYSIRNAIFTTFINTYQFTYN